MKIIVTTIPTNLITKSLLRLFCPFLETIIETNIQYVVDLVTRNIYFLLIPSHSVLHWYTKLWKIFLHIICGHIIVP